MTFHIFIPDENITGTKDKQRAIKLRKQIDEQGIKSLDKQGHSVNLGIPTEHYTKAYKVIEESENHQVIDLQQPVKKNVTVKEFHDLSGL